MQLDLAAMLPRLGLAAGLALRRIWQEFCTRAGG
jgi:hypothetical protein